MKRTENGQGEEIPRQYQAHRVPPPIGSDGRPRLKAEEEMTARGQLKLPQLVVTSEGQIAPPNYTPELV